MPAGARALVPAFDPDVLAYNLSAPLEHTVASVRVAPIANDTEYDRVLVNGARQPSGALSREISVPAGYGNGNQTTRGETTITVVVVAQDGITRRAYTVFVQRDPAPIFPDDATLRELRVSPRPSARLGRYRRAYRARAYRLFVPARASFAGVTPVANDVNVFKIEVNGVELANGEEYRTTMAELLRREDVVARIEVFAANCDPAWRPEGFDAADEDADGDAETLLLDGKYRPTWCSTRVYEVELLEYGPGAYEGVMHLRAGDAEDPTGIVREMTPFPSPFGDTAAFLASLEQRDVAEFDGGVRSSGSEGECDEYLCANSISDPSLVSIELRVASATPAAVGDDPLPSVGASAGDAVAFAPAFSNVTRLYVAEVPSHRVDAIEINVTAASANVSGVFVDGVAVRSGAFSAPVALKEGAATAVAVEVVAGREDTSGGLRAPRVPPAIEQRVLRSLAVQIGSVESPGAAPIAITKRVALNLTGVPQPRRACDLYDAAARAANGVAFHPQKMRRPRCDESHHRGQRPAELRGGGDDPGGGLGADHGQAHAPVRRGRLGDVFGRDVRREPHRRGGELLRGVRRRGERGWRASGFGVPPRMVRLPGQRRRWHRVRDAPRRGGRSRRPAPRNGRVLPQLPGAAA